MKKHPVIKLRLEFKITSQ